MTGHDRRNALLNIIGESVWGLQSNVIMSATVLTVLLRHFGAQARMIGVSSVSSDTPWPDGRLRRRC